jgi:hypothetical protein
LEKIFTKNFLRNSGKLKKFFKILKNFQKKFKGRKKFPEIFLGNSGKSEKNFKNFRLIKKNNIQENKIPCAHGTKNLI